MTVFLRLLADKDKAESLRASCAALRSNDPNDKVFLVESDAFRAIPGTPFSYWANERVLSCFEHLPTMETMGAQTKCGAGTLDDFRFLRLWWEVSNRTNWVPFPKGGTYSPWYGEIPLIVSWKENGRELKQFVKDKVGSTSRKIQAQEFYFRRGITWPRRTNGLSFRFMPHGCIFADKGPAAFIVNDVSEGLMSLCAIMNSQSFSLLVSLQLARTELAQSFEVGLIQQTPIPDLGHKYKVRLATLARRGWSLKRLLNTVEETSHAFLTPAELRGRLRDYDPPAIEAELLQTQAEINGIGFDLYGFSAADCATTQPSNAPTEGDGNSAEGDFEEDESAAPADRTADLLSWTVGVAFGRFDWRLAIGDRAPPPEPEPFDQLPVRSPGMLPDDAEPFHRHPGILVDDLGHQHHLARVTEEVLIRVDASVPSDIRRWLRRDFFPFHLQRYSKSRRKAPIYWPLATASGGYTVWLYYPSLTDQTLYTAVNDFIIPKLEDEIRPALLALLTSNSRTRDEERTLEQLQDLDSELRELRDELLRLAPTWKPHHDDGVQITAAPLWRLFRYRPWQNVLKETWEKLERGDYDWAHLAMSFWPDRVRGKCRADKSLAIAHGLEDLYEPPPEKAGAGRRGRKRMPEAS